MPQNVAIIGASVKPHRYAFKAQDMLMDYGHQVFPVSKRGVDILGVEGYQSVAQINQPIDTVTLYINAGLHEAEIESIINIQPKRVIFNPGTESELLMARYQAEDIEVLEACTLVMLRTNQF